MGLSGAALLGVAMLAGCGSSAAKVSSAKPLNFLDTWDYNAGLTPMNSNSVSAIMNGLVTTNLAMQLQDNNQYYPEMAQSWKQVGNTLTINLRKNAKWSNGTALTAQDVKLSIEMGYILGYSTASRIQSIHIVNPHTIQIVETAPFAYFLHDLLVLTPLYPYSEYGHLIPSNIAQIYATSQGSGAAATKASNTLSALSKKISAYRSNYFLGDGPFAIKSMTSGEAILKKNPYFWNAAAVKVPEILAYNVPGNAQAWGYFLGNRADFGSYVAPPNIMKQWMHSSSHHFVKPSAFAQATLVFNPNIYPFNMVKVRQAMAYIINRQAVTHIAEPVIGHWVRRPAGAFFSLTKHQDLTTAQYQALNPYAYNPGRATTLLEQAGFHKASSGWIMPNGKPFVTQVVIPAGFSDWLMASQQISSELTHFGISASARSVEQSSYFNAFDQNPGGYPIFMNFGGGSPVPYFQMTNFLSWFAYNRTASGAVKHAKGYISLGGRSVTLTNGSTVNIPQLGYGLAAAALNPSHERADVAKISAALNQTMVAEGLWNYTGNYMYSSSHYVGWPSPSSPAWTPYDNNNGEEVLAFFIDQGLLTPAN